jgi:hypothetical protein
MNYNIKMDLKEVWWKGADYIHLAQDSDKLWDPVNTIMNIWVLLKDK